ncbi:unnamed protein product [Rangifer tarandus platyrhynchus]|uniref:Uncharacterized protein n=2 Tax=Rangifer tarandus platyrhynchus TaxID=3082113 RepID=A0ACB0E785_RANTA|nr:unnamed protein product [Rangifer tarandus platyrhynchus]CAI9696179.1 unnamed protein product [Rangifer tarandus platyrhynchus]
MPRAGLGRRTSGRRRGGKERKRERECARSCAPRVRGRRAGAGPRRPTHRAAAPGSARPPLRACPVGHEAPETLAHGRSGGRSPLPPPSRSPAPARVPESGLPATTAIAAAGRPPCRARSCAHRLGRREGLAASGSLQGRGTSAATGRAGLREPGRRAACQPGSAGPDGGGPVRSPPAAPLLTTRARVSPARGLRSQRPLLSDSLRGAHADARD